MNVKLRALVGLAIVALMVGACGTGGTATTGPTAAVPSAAASSGAEVPSAAAPSASLDTTPVTIKVWDYYGDSTPIKPALDGFKKEFPWITVDYEALDWDSMNEKFNAGIGAGEVPDMATLDMTWLPTLAAERRARRPDSDLRRPAQRDADHRPVHAGRPGRDAFRERDGGDAVRLRHLLAVLPEGPVRRRRASRSRRTGTSCARRPRHSPSRPSRAASPTST